MKKLALIFALALATTTPAFARAGGGGGHGVFHGGGMHTGRSVGFHGGGYRGGYRHVYRGGGYGYGYGYNEYNGYYPYNGYYGVDPGAAIGLGILGGVLGGRTQSISHRRHMRLSVVTPSSRA